MESLYSFLRNQQQICKVRWELWLLSHEMDTKFTTNPFALHFVQIPFEKGMNPAFLSPAIGWVSWVL